MNFKKIDPKMKLPEMEKEVLKFWEENKIFEKSLENRKDSPAFSFYDGPPFASGSPHYGHIVGSAMKDAVPRYWTMRGFNVPRKWGWDCHGLPIENIAEKELGIKHKKEIEEMGVDKFNEFCRTKVLKYVDEWKAVINRLGRWADMENSYKTMDLSFMESVWWVFKELWNKGLIYEGHRIMHICTRCETTLSQSEVAEGYKDIKDISATVKFELEDESTSAEASGDKARTFILAWTTTPWTLIGNVALAIGEKIDYVKIPHKRFSSAGAVEFEAGRLYEKMQKPGFYIISKAAFDINFAKVQELIENYSEFEKDIIYSELSNKEVLEKYNIEVFKGKDLIGKSYKPLFNYYVNKGLENEENGWQIYAGDFVTTEEGTGVVHIAPAFGEDDAKMGQEYKLPFVQHVGMDGMIKPEATDFAGMSVKPEKDHQSTDVEVIKYLAKNNLLFSKEKYEHSYPHCWRCDTPLINYATSSWFVNITKIKEKMLKNAKEINWIPTHLKEGRFGNWLEGARDWSISRQRFWASVIPIWKCEGHQNKLIIITGPCGAGKTTVASLLANNEKTVVINGDDVRKEVFGDMKIITNRDFEKIKKVNQEIIERIKKYLRDGKNVIVDYVGVVFNLEDYKKELNSEFLLRVFFPKKEVLSERDKNRKEWNNGEDFTKSDWDLFNEKKKDLGAINYVDNSELSAEEIAKKYFTSKLGCGETKVFGSVKELEELSGEKITDLHKHIVDKITFKCEKCGGTMKRVPDVLDTWFDSGSMPYAQAHYPFENKEDFDKNFPAEFIAEGVDQTRCWFYYLHAISIAIKDSNAYKNVAVNGIVLAEDGKKMAKRLKNYPDPTEIFDKYGADALRFYLLSSPVISAETINFKESEVAELVRGMFRMLWNSYSFFVLYANIDKFEIPENYKSQTESLLDKWIVSELNMLIKNVNESMENYELNKAVRYFPKFIDDFSNWYIRRSRKRFWKSENDRDKKEAYETLHYVLVELSKLMAPFTPFISEEIYKNLTGKESVHLADFPKADESLVDYKLNEEMKKVREIVSAGLQLRAKAKIKVRQPLQEASSEYEISSIDLIDIIKEELNVKEFNIDNIKSKSSIGKIKLNSKEFKIDDVNLESSVENIKLVKLNTEITEDLKLEGQAREIIRHIQEMRKEAGYEIENRIVVRFEGMEKVFKKFGELIAKEVLANKMKSGKMDSLDLEKEFKIDGEKLTIEIKKQE